MSAGGTESPGGARMVPFHCPYCGDEDLHPRPAEPRADGQPSPGSPWECRSCVRAFALTYLGPATGPLLPDDLRQQHTRQQHTEPGAARP